MRIKTCIKFMLILVVVLLTNCATQSKSTIIGCDYDKNKDQTEYFVFPYGTVSISGRWIRTTNNHVSRQQFFQNSDSIIIAIALGPCSKYEFYLDNSKKGFEFVNAFYEWDSQYFVEHFHLNQEKIESDKDSNYIIWRVFGQNNNTLWDTYLLIGEKDGITKNYSIMKTHKWNRDDKIRFLKEMYLGVKKN